MAAADPYTKNFVESQTLSAFTSLRCASASLSACRRSRFALSTRTAFVSWRASRSKPCFRPGARRPFLWGCWLSLRLALLSPNKRTLLFRHL